MAVFSHYVHCPHNPLFLGIFVCLPSKGRDGQRHPPIPLPDPTITTIKPTWYTWSTFGKPRLAGEAGFERELFYTNTTYIYTLCNLY